MSFDKYHLMRDEEYQRLRQKQVQSYNPELRILTRLDDEMKDIIADTSVPVDVKLSILNQVKAQMKDVKSSVAKAVPPPPSVVVPKPTVVEPEQEEEEYGEEDFYDASQDEVFDSRVLTGITAKTQKSKARGLLKLIQANPNVISKNENNELVVHGKAIPGSNYVDLFNSLYTSHVPGSSPEGATGHTHFLKALSKLNVPTSLISRNAQTEKLMQLRHTSPSTTSSSKHQIGKGLMPPGNRHRMITLYRV